MAHITVCDCCGGQAGTYETYRLELVKKDLTGESRKKLAAAGREKDLCGFCAQRVREFLDSLKKK